MYHTSVIIHSSPKIRIISFGGLDTLPEDDDVNKAVPIAQTTIVELCKYVHIISFLLWEERSSVYSMFTCIIIIP